MFPHLKIEYTAIKVGHTPVPTFKSSNLYTWGSLSFLMPTFYREFPVKHVKVEVVGEMLGNPLPFRFFEPSKPTRASMFIVSKYAGVEPVQGAVFGEHPDSPDSCQSLPIHQFYVRSLQGIFPARLGVDKHNLLICDLQMPWAHRPTHLKPFFNWR